MPIHPVRLKSVVSNHFDVTYLERRGGEPFDASPMDAAEQVGLACAVGTGTIPAELLESVVGFVAVTPDDRKLVADDLKRICAHGEGNLTDSRMISRCLHSN
jgi:hypothetical protein